MRSGMTECCIGRSRRRPSIVMVGGAVALDARPHAAQRLGEVADLRLAGAVLEHRAPLGEGGGHHRVLGPGDRREVEHERGAPQATARCARLDVAVLQRDLRAEGGEDLEVLIDRTSADGAAARQRHARPAPAGDERSQDEHARAHRLHELVGRLGRGGGRDADDGYVPVLASHLAPHVREQAAHRPDVGEVGHVADPVFALREQGRCERRQRRILRARDFDGATEGHATFDDDLVHPTFPTGRRY